MMMYMQLGLKNNRANLQHMQNLINHIFTLPLMVMKLSISVALHDIISIGGKFCISKESENGHCLQFHIFRKKPLDKKREKKEKREEKKREKMLNT